jgi:hypothetical protein
MSADHDLGAVGPLPDAIWEKIEAEIPCDKSTMFRMETQEEFLTLRECGRRRD